MAVALAELVVLVLVKLVEVLLAGIGVVSIEALMVVEVSGVEVTEAVRPEPPIMKLRVETKAPEVVPSSARGLRSLNKISARVTHYRQIQHT